MQFDSSVNFEKQGGYGSSGWSSPAPTTAHEPQVGVNSNVLCVSADVESNSISVTTADRIVRRVSTEPPFEADTEFEEQVDSPVLSTVFVPGGFVLATSMSGHLSLRRSSTNSLLDVCRHHSKYTVQVVSDRIGTNWFIATAGWDQKVHIYAPDTSRIGSAPIDTGGANEPSLPGVLGAPFHTVVLQSNPESLLFARHPDTQDLYLIVSRRDSTHLQYYRMEVQQSGRTVVQEAGRQNLAPHSNAWVAFTPCSLAPCPVDTTLIAVATSHIPHMKLILVRLLFPISKADQANSTAPGTQAAMARTELATQDREDAAITFQVNTMAPQTPYSTPQVVWRPDGSGVFVNGDDGAIRGIEAITGKVICLLKGHEPGSKVRTLWAGLVEGGSDGSKQEILVSGGFDKRLLIWTAANN